MAWVVPLHHALLALPEDADAGTVGTCNTSSRKQVDSTHREICLVPITLREVAEHVCGQGAKGSMSSFDQEHRARVWRDLLVD